MRRLAAKLNLNDEQKTQLLALQSALDSARDCLAKWQSEQMRQFETQLMQERFDRQEVLSTLAPSTATLTRGASPVVDAFGQFHASLDPAQRQKLLAIWRQRASCH